MAYCPHAGPRTSLDPAPPHQAPAQLTRVESGLPLASMAAILDASESPFATSTTFVIPARTLKHRRAQHSTLSPDESDKLARLARIFDQAVGVFGDTERARDWLTQPKSATETAPPSTCSAPRSAAAWSRKCSARSTRTCSPKQIS